MLSNNVIDFVLMLIRQKVGHVDTFCYLEHTTDTCRVTQHVRIRKVTVITVHMDTVNIRVTFVYLKDAALKSDQAKHKHSAAETPVIRSDLCETRPRRIGRCWWWLGWTRRSVCPSSSWRGKLNRFIIQLHFSRKVNQRSDHDPCMPS